MRAELRSHKLTYQDYLQFPEDGRRHELIDGEHFVTAAPNVKHQTLLALLTELLGGFVRRNKLGRVWATPLDVVLSDFDIVQPDLIFLSRERFQLLTEAHLRGAPDLAVEVLSPSTRRRDLSDKLRLYERSGVTEYWVVDPEEDTVEVYRQNEGGYRLEARLSVEQGDTLSSPLFPGWALALEELFHPLSG